MANDCVCVRYDKDVTRTRLSCAPTMVEYLKRIDDESLNAQETLARMAHFDHDFAQTANRFLINELTLLGFDMRHDKMIPLMAITYIEFCTIHRSIRFRINKAYEPKDS